MWSCVADVRTLMIWKRLTPCSIIESVKELQWIWKHSKLTLMQVTQLLGD